MGFSSYLEGRSFFKRIYHKMNAIILLEVFGFSIVFFLIDLRHPNYHLFDSPIPSISG